MNFNFITALMIAMAFLLGGCSSFRPENFKHLSLVTYNVENLFDNDHDQGKEDYAYLPTNHPAKRGGCLKVKIPFRQRQCFDTDWTQKALELKIKQIKKVIQSIDDGRPDFLALVEVENEKVLALLAEELGYRHFVISQGADERGIDVALLWNERADIHWQSTREILISNTQYERPTRPILEVSFIIAQKYPLSLFVNHWPSQGSPNGYRILAAKTLKERMIEIQTNGPKTQMIALGDFNTIESNHPNALFDTLLADMPLVDLHQAYLESDGERSISMPEGTYFFARDNIWNLLDRMIVSRELLSPQGLSIDLSSYKIFAKDFMTKTYRFTDKTSPHYGKVVKGVPKRSNHKAKTTRGAGFSDHFPVFVRLNYPTH